MILEPEFIDTNVPVEHETKYFPNTSRKRTHQGVSLDFKELPKSGVSDHTPTPTRFIRNCEEVGLFQDLQKINPFEEGFRKALNCTSSVNEFDANKESQTNNDDTLHTPNILPHISGVYSLNKKVNKGSGHEIIKINNSDSEDDSDYEWQIVCDDERWHEHINSKTNKGSKSKMVKKQKQPEFVKLEMHPEIAVAIQKKLPEIARQPKQPKIAKQQMQPGIAKPAEIVRQPNQQKLFPQPEIARQPKQPKISKQQMQPGIAKPAEIVRQPNQQKLCPQQTSQGAGEILKFKIIKPKPQKDINIYDKNTPYRDRRKEMNRKSQERSRSRMRNANEQIDEELKRLREENTKLKNYNAKVNIEVTQLRRQLNILSSKIILCQCKDKVQSTSTSGGATTKVPQSKVVQKTIVVKLKTGNTNTATNTLRTTLTSKEVPSTPKPQILQTKSKHSPKTKILSKTKPILPKIGSICSLAPTVCTTPNGGSSTIMCKVNDDHLNIKRQISSKPVGILFDDGLVMPLKAENT